jgi:hypothetical protein
MRDSELIGFSPSFRDCCERFPSVCSANRLWVRPDDVKISPDFSDNFALNPGSGLVRFTPPRGLKTAAHQGHWVRFFASLIGAGLKTGIAAWMRGGNAVRRAIRLLGNERYAPISTELCRARLTCRRLDRLARRAFLRSKRDHSATTHGFLGVFRHVRNLWRRATAYAPLPGARDRNAVAGRPVTPGKERDRRCALARPLFV